MKFFNQFIDPAFRKNEKGETFFFPWGNFGKAYPVKTEEEIKKLRIAMSVLTIAGSIGSVSMLLFFGGFAVLLFLIFAIFSSI